MNEQKQIKTIDSSRQIKSRKMRFFFYKIIFHLKILFNETNRSFTFVFFFLNFQMKNNFTKKIIFLENILFNETNRSFICIKKNFNFLEFFFFGKFPYPGRVSSRNQLSRYFCLGLMLIPSFPSSSKIWDSTGFCKKRIFKSHKKISFLNKINC